MASKRPLEECSTPPSKFLKIQNSPVRKFKDSWKTGQSWLRFEANSKEMFCDICILAQNSNSFVTGCNVLKKESVTKHAKIKGNYNDKEHNYVRPIMY